MNTRAIFMLGLHSEPQSLTRIKECDSYHYTKITFVHACVSPSVRDGTLPTFTGNRVVPEAFPSLATAWRLPVEYYGKRQLSAVGRHDGKLRTCMEGE